VIVVRNTTLNVPLTSVELISRQEFITAIASVPKGLAAASGQISLWRKPEPGDSISVVFAAAGKSPPPSGCESSHHYPDRSALGLSTRLELDTYFDVRAPIVVKEHESPSDIEDPSSQIHKDLLQSLTVRNCDLIANAYSEGLTLAKGLAAVEVGDTNGEKKYKQFFLLVFDFASPAYGSSEFNATFNVSDQDLAPGTPAYFIAPIGSLKFANQDWSLDLVNYFDYPAVEPGGQRYLERNKANFYPRLRFYRAVAHETSSDPFYDLATSQTKVASLEDKLKTSEAKLTQHANELISLHNNVAILERRLDTSNNERDDAIMQARKSAFAAWGAAATIALLMVLAAWWWWANKGRFRRMAEEHQEELQRMRTEQSKLAEKQERDLTESRQALDEEFRKKQAALEAEEVKLKSLLANAFCIPDAPDKDQASESA